MKNLENCSSTLNSYFKKTLRKPFDTDDIFYVLVETLCASKQYLVKTFGYTQSFYLPSKTNIWQIVEKLFHP